MDKKVQVQQMFDKVSKKYDFLNHLLSAGIDYYWRKKALKKTGVNKDTILLDIACGTGDFSIEARKKGVQKIYGADLSFNMLKVFNQKTDFINGKITQCVAEDLPFKNKSFTNIVIGFGVRNFYNLLQSFQSMHRILTENGKVTILEFRLPKNPIIKAIYNFYFNRILPLIGNMISEDKEAYTYLPESVSDFDENVNLKELLIEAGFKSVDVKSVTFGIVQLVIAQK